MPLRDHFRPPIYPRHSCEGFYGIWPGEMVRTLVPHLPDGYFAEPRVHLGNLYELDVNAYEFDPDEQWSAENDRGGGVMTAAAHKLRKPQMTFEADLTEEYEYEVRVFDNDRKLVAAVEIASPGNKDRPSNRKAFVSKCAALLQQRVCVTIVDIVVNRNFNLYRDLLTLIDRKDPAFGFKAPRAYAVTLRGRKTDSRSFLDAWPHALQVGEKLPTLPIWLNEDELVPLDLETSYSEACRVLRVPG